MGAALGAAWREPGPISWGTLGPSRPKGRDLRSELAYLTLQLRDATALIDHPAAKLAQSGADSLPLDPGHAGEIRTHRRSGQACAHALRLGCMPPSAWEELRNV